MSMDRGSSQQGSRADEELRHETEAIERGGHDARAEEGREPEPPGEDQPRISRVPGGRRPGCPPPGMNAGDVAGRSELARSLQPSVFPADRDDLLESAAQTGAADVVVTLLERLPAGTAYRNVQDVWRALGGGTEDVDHRT